MHPGCDIEQVYLCREPIDFRKSINGLSVLVEQELELKETLNNSPRSEARRAAFGFSGEIWHFLV